MRDSAWRKSEIARSACATMRVSREISIYRAQRSQQGCSLSLGMLRLAEPPTGRARLRSSLKSPRNPITPFETSRVSTLHPGLYKGLREGGRRGIGRAMCGNSFHRLRAVPLPRRGRSVLLGNKRMQNTHSDVEPSRGNATYPNGVLGSCFPKYSV